MSLRKFEAIDSCIAFSNYSLEQYNNDPYIRIRPLVNAFNERRKQVVVPGGIIVINECMSSWRGREQFVKHKRFIHITKIPRKPKSVGVEMKASCDCQSGILLFIVD
jgi:hypothetical protein